jgi:hypothetical protein
LDDFSVSDGQSVNPIHAFLEKELPMQDWSRLTHSRLLSPERSIPVVKGPIGICVLEILFSNSEIGILARSRYCEIEEGVVLSLLSEKARDRFGQANIIRCRGNPAALLERLGVSSDWFIGAIFLRRDDLGALADAFTPAGEEEAARIEGLASRVPEECLFSFFVGAVFPNVSLFSAEFLRALFARTGFPSDDPNFPVVEFIASASCRENVSLKVFLDVFARAPKDESLFDIFRQLINADDDAGMILTAMFRSPVASIDVSRDLFVMFVQSSASLSPALLCQAASRHLSRQAEAVSALYGIAIVERIRPELFLTTELLQIFWDYAFVSPGPTLQFLLAVAEHAGEVDSISEFWDSPTTIPCLIDAVETFHERSSDFIDFLLELGRKASQPLVRKLGQYALELPCRHVFRQHCVDRFGPGWDM